MYILAVLSGLSGLHTHTHNRECIVEGYGEENEWEEELDLIKHILDMYDIPKQ